MGPRGGGMYENGVTIYMTAVEKKRLTENWQQQFLGLEIK